MKKMLLSAVLLFAVAFSESCRANEPERFNLGFESVRDGMPDQWSGYSSDGYIVGVDSLVCHGGRYSAFIASDTDDASGFRAWGLTLPGSYEGKSITLAGYLKTENVTDGFAGLWMRIDPNVAFDNMGDRGVTGTTDWTRFEITLPLNPEQMEQTVIGGLLIGRGKMWIDDLSVTIDGKSIEKMTVRREPEYAAQQDHMFDAGSGITEIAPDAENVRLLKDVGLIWGFLKYYHPEVAAGKYNWDYELFRILPSLLDEKDRAGRDALLVRWIEGLGSVTASKGADKKENNVKISPDLDWITGSGFSEELVAALTKVRDANRSDRHYYIGMEPMVGNPRFLHENAYDAMHCPDAGFRLLSLYRYWNMIQYFYPNRELIGEDWKGVLGEFVPRFVQADSEEEYLLTSLEIIARIHDTHANLWMRSPVLDDIRGRNFAAPALAFVGGQAVVTGFSDQEEGAKTGLQVGDVITDVDGKPVGGIIRERLATTPASNYPTQLRDIASNLLRTNDASLQVGFDRNGTKGEVTLSAPYTTNPNNFAQKSVPAFKLLPGNVAYLYPGSLKAGEINDLWLQIKDTKGLVVDLRCYPSDFIVFSLGGRLVSRSTPFVRFTMGDVRTPGQFTLSESLPVGGQNADSYGGKVVILVNETTQSQAEYTAMALRTAPHAVVVGSTTAGADGNVSEILLPGGVRTMISGIGILYPDGRETQRVGIVPDIELHPTVRGIAEGRDELLERAVGLIGE